MLCKVAAKNPDTDCPGSRFRRPVPAGKLGPPISNVVTAMKNKRVLNPAGVVAVTSTVATIFGSITASAADVTVARYSTVHPTPSLAQQDPLAAPVDMALPDVVTRIGDAVEWLLAPSGYRLSPASAAAPERQDLLALPLPDVHRALGPLPLRTALQILVGPQFSVIEDPVHRFVSFERCERKGGGS